jgi:hypothetical protein
MIVMAFALQIAAGSVPPPVARSNVSRPPVVVNRAPASIDFANMPIEDAIMLMFGMIADDARDDMREQMEEMKKVAIRKEEARELLTKMAAERARIDGDVRAYFQARGNKRSFPSFVEWRKSQQISMPTVQMDSTSGQAELTKPGGFTAPDAPPAETDTRPCINRADEDDCVIRAMRARLEWLRQQPAR